MQLIICIDQPQIIRTWFLSEYHSNKQLCTYSVKPVFCYDNVIHFRMLILSYNVFLSKIPGSPLGQQIFLFLAWGGSASFIFAQLSHNYATKQVFQVLV